MNKTAGCLSCIVYLFMITSLGLCQLRKELLFIISNKTLKSTSRLLINNIKQDRGIRVWKTWFPKTKSLPSLFERSRICYKQSRYLFHFCLQIAYMFIYEKYRKFKRTTIDMFRSQMNKHVHIRYIMLYIDWMTF